MSEGLARRTYRYYRCAPIEGEQRAGKVDGRDTCLRTPETGMYIYSSGVWKVTNTLFVDFAHPAPEPLVNSTWTDARYSRDCIVTRHTGTPKLLTNTGAWCSAL